MPDTTLPQAINDYYLKDEEEVVKQLLEEAESLAMDRGAINREAAQWVSEMRQHRKASALNEAFMREYDLSSEEGIILMAMAEALLRIPDGASAEQLIHDYLSKGNWLEHLGHSDSNLVNFASWGLKVGSQFATLTDQQAPALWRSLASRLGAPLMRQAISAAMGVLGYQFVMGQTIDDALKRSAKSRSNVCLHSFDMLGEAAVCQADVEHYFNAYQQAINALAKLPQQELGLYQREGISVKLSALHPRYELAQRQRVMKELIPRLLELAQLAMAAEITLTLDAEECDRLELSLEIFLEIYNHASLAHWGGFGLAVQAYQKRALPVVKWLVNLSQQSQRKIPVRLVKGAYWDNEIKRAQQQGLQGYPVFTRKQSTDLSYLVCASHLLSAPYIYCQFATHNAHTIAAISDMAPVEAEFEFQRLHGMGESLYRLVNSYGRQIPVRVYSPVGGHRELLPYLVRRLLENGANSSFVNRIWDEQIEPQEVVADPISYVKSLQNLPHPQIPLPEQMYGEERLNSKGLNLGDSHELQRLQQAISGALLPEYIVTPRGAGMGSGEKRQDIVSPADVSKLLGYCELADEKQLQLAMDSALAAHTDWQGVSVAKRAEILLHCAELLEHHHVELLALMTAEAGKTLPDGVAELREAVDFCRYYAQQIQEKFSAPLTLPGPVGEENQLYLSGRGVFVTISPWNFPIAIFTGQIAAALAAGNCVLAKPAHQTTIVADRVVQLFYQAGVPQEVLYLLPSSGRMISQQLLSHPKIAGVAFTGSTDTAQSINLALASRKGAIAPLIAETGGQNAMLVDSSALPEQVVKDVIRSAFNSAGQRCSALRVLYLQEEIAEAVIKLLTGAMAELIIGNPAEIHTDVGPVIDEEAYDKLVLHAAQLEAKGQLLYQTPLPEGLNGYFVAPSLFEINTISDLPHEVFGPMLHVIRYRSKSLDKVMDEINDCGYGLTLGVHSRIQQRIDAVRKRAHVGNLYINRDMVGAVVGVQPFGGEGLSGTGFKAGGPHYLYRFCTERSVSINSAAIGGNTQLLNLEDSD